MRKNKIIDYKWKILGIITLIAVSVIGIKLNISVSYAAPPSSFFNTTYYEHLATRIFNTTSPLEVLQSNTVAFPGGGTTTLAWAFTKDLAESGNGIIIPSGTYNFFGSFNAIANNDRNVVYINWQLVELNVTTAAEVEICRTPTTTGGALVTSTTAQMLSRNCTVVAPYHVKPGNKLRVNVYGHNTASQTKSISHLWDTTVSSSRYSLTHETPGIVEANLSSPLSDPNAVVNFTFNLVCKVTCNGGDCLNTQVFAQYKKSSGSFVDINTTLTENLILNGTETNPHSFNFTGTEFTAFVIRGNIESANNNIRCRAFSPISGSSIGSVQTNVTVFAVDVTLPTIVFESPTPTNGEVIISSSPVNVTINATITDNVAVDVVKLEFNGVNESMIKNGDNYQKNKTGLSSGIYTYRIYANDTPFNNLAVSETRTFTVNITTIDVTPPTVSLMSPANNSMQSVGNVIFEYNVTDLSTISSCSLIINGAVNQTDTTITKDVLQSFNQVFSDGTYNWRVDCTDSSSNMGSSQTRTFVVDASPPIVTFVTPTPANNSFLSQTTITINVSLSETPNTCTLEFDGINETMTKSGNTCFKVKSGLSETQHAYRVYANDSGNNLGVSETRVVTLDVTVPSLTVQSPTNKTFSVSSIPLSYTVSDNLQINTCFFSLDNGPNTTLAGCLNTTLTSLSEGSHAIKVFANDSTGNLNTSQISFSVDTIIPNVTFVSPTPANNTFTNKTFVFINATLTESPDACILQFDGINTTMSKSGANCFLNKTGISEGLHTYNIFANDSANNIGFTETRLITVDVTPPSVSIQSPPNATINSSNVDVNYTAADNIGLATCFFSLDSGPNTNLTNCQNTTLTNLAEGSHNVKVFARDLAGNQNFSQVGFVVDLRPPNVTIVLPIQGFVFNKKNVVTIMADVFDVSGINSVFANITRPDNLSFISTLTDPESDGSFIGFFTNTTVTGVYNLTIIATDNLGKVNNTQKTFFNVTIFPPVVKDIKPLLGSTFNISGIVNISANVTDPLGVANVSANITLPNGDIVNIPLVNRTSSIYEANFTDLMLKGTYTVRIIATNSENVSNATVTTTFDRISVNTVDVIDAEGNVQSYNVTILSNVSGVLSLEVIPNATTVSTVQKITILGYNETSPLSVIKLENNTLEPSTGQQQTFSIDLSLLSFSTANLTITAKGNNLLKCTKFNFTSQTCESLSDYVQVRSNLIPGQVYTITLNATDPGFTETVSGPANISDSYIVKGSPTSNFGGSTIITVGEDPSGDEVRGIIRFNISLPSGIQITDAQLKLFFFSVPGGDSTTNRTQGVHRVQQSPTRDWVENEVTWNNYKTLTPWTLQGGDFAASPTDTQQVGDTFGFNSWNVTTDVANFSVDPSKNFGWIIKDENENTIKTRRNYRSSEGLPANETPQLIIQYIDIQAPTVTIVEPQNITYGVKNISLNYTVTDNIAIGTCFSSLDNGPNTTLANCTNATLTNLSDGSHTVKVFANDTSGNIGSAQISFSVDTANPVVTFIAPTPANGAFIPVTFAFINTTISKTPNTCTLEFDGVNSSMTISGSNCFFNKTGLSQGLHTYRVYANDSLGNLGISSLRNVTVDLTTPSINVTSPANGSTVGPNNVPLNYIATDNFQLNTCFFSLDGGTNTTLSNCTNSTLSGLSNGAHNITVFANDSAGNLNSSSVTFSVDAIAPTITFVAPTPANNTFINVTFIFVNTTISETPSVCNLEVDGINTTMTKSGNNCFLNKTSLTEGTHTYKVYANDSVGNLGVSETRIIKVDLTAPSVNIINPPQPGNFTDINKPNATGGKDSYINDATATTNYGTDTTIRIGRVANNNVFRGTIEFNISNIPSGATINSAILKLNLVSTGTATSTSITANRITESWTESGVTWNTRNGSTGWTTLGGTFSTVDSVTVTGITNVVGTYSWNITNITRGWYNGTASNFGLLLKTPETANEDTKNFASSDNANSTLHPILEITYTTGNATFTVSSVALNFTVSDNFQVSTCYYSLDGGPNAALPTCANTTLTNLLNGDHNVKVFANDGAGNLNLSQVGFSINVSTPIAIFSPPTPTNNSFINVTFVFINASASPTPISFCNLEFDGVNQSMNVNGNGCFVNKTGLAQGNHTYRVFANTSTGINVTETRNLIVDLTPPGFANMLESPIDPTSSSGPYTFSIDWIDNFVVNDARLEFDGSNFTFSSGSVNKTVNTYSKSFTNLTKGTHNYTWFANDSAGNTNVTSQQNYTVLKSSASLTLTILPSNSITEGTQTTATCTTNDPVNLTLFRNSVQVSNPDIQTLVAGTYTYLCSSNETTDFSQTNATAILQVTTAAPPPPPPSPSSGGGGGGSSPTITPAPDTTKPIINILSPADTLYSTQTLLLQISSSETLKECTYSLDGSASATFDCKSTSITRVQEGDHIVAVFAKDLSGNNATASRHFAIDLTPPQISLILTSENIFVGESTVAICSAISDGIQNIEIIAPGTKGPSPLIYTPTIEGTYEITCTASDRSWNAETVSKILVVTTPRPGYQPPPFAAASTYISLIEKEKITSFDFVKAEIPIKQISFVSSDMQRDVSLLLHRVGEPSITPIGTKFAYLELVTQNLDESLLKDIKLKFEVDKNWIRDNEVNLDTGVLVRLSDDQWVDLDTTLVSETINSYIFEARSPGLSLFAVKFQPLICQCVPQDWGACSEGLETRVAYDCGAETNYGCIPTIQTRSCALALPVPTPPPEIPITTVALGIIVFAILPMIWIYRKG